jgi:threonine dehydratase
VFLKLETLQPTFSYKIRGALNAALRLAEEHGANAPPLVTASAGNHGRALAHAARATGLRLTVYVPAGAPHTKLNAIRNTGAEVKTCRDYDEAELRAKEHGATTGALFVSPYADADVIAGAGTVGLEILEERPDVDLIVVPVGGGGLISGVSTVAKGISDRTSVVGVEAAASCAFTRSLAAGRIVPIDVGPTLADGLAGNLDRETVTFDIVRRLVSGMVVVSEADIRAAIRGVLLEERLVAEGAAAAAVGAVLSKQIPGHGRRMAIVLSGGNIDPETLKSVL